MKLPEAIERVAHHQPEPIFRVYGTSGMSERRRHPECVGGAPVGSLQYEACHWRERELATAVRAYLAYSEVGASEQWCDWERYVDGLRAALREVEL